MSRVLCVHKMFKSFNWILCLFSGHQRRPGSWCITPRYSVTCLIGDPELKDQIFELSVVDWNCNTFHLLLMTTDIVKNICDRTLKQLSVFLKNSFAVTAATLAGTVINILLVLVWHSMALLNTKLDMDLTYGVHQLGCTSHPSCWCSGDILRWIPLVLNTFIPCIATIFKVSLPRPYIFSKKILYFQC